MDNNIYTFWITSMLQTFAREKMNVVQIGAWTGSDTKEFIHIIKQNEGKLTVIDWFRGNVGDSDKPESTDSGFDEYVDDDKIIKNRIKKFWDNINETGCQDIVDLKIGESHDILPTLEDESIDILFIDGGHEYSIIKKDLELGFPKVKSGGFLCGDDYSGEYHYNKINEISGEDLEKDTIPGIGYSHDEYDNISPNIHAGVIKAVYEYFGGNVMVNLPQSKWLHWKAPISPPYNLEAYKPGKWITCAKTENPPFNLEDFKVGPNIDSKWSQWIRVTKK